jgi:hypothetical protein
VSLFNVPTKKLSGKFTATDDRIAPPSQDIKKSDRQVGLLNVLYGLVVGPTKMCIAATRPGDSMFFSSRARFIDSRATKKEKKNILNIYSKVMTSTCEE